MQPCRFGGSCLPQRHGYTGSVQGFAFIVMVAVAGLPGNIL